MSKTPRPTAAELAILQVLWEQGPATVRKVHELMAAQAGDTAEAPVDFCVVPAGEAQATAALLLAESLRSDCPDAQVVSICGGGSLKSQMKRADRTGARVALILGEDELASGTVSVKLLREQAPQQRIERAGLAEALRALRST